MKKQKASASSKKTLENKILLLEKKLLSQKNKLQKTLINHSRFISTLNHDLKNPLTIMINGLSQLRDDVYGPTNDAQKRILFLSLKNSSRLTHILNDASLCCKLEADLIKLNKNKEDVVVLFQESLAVFTNLIKEKNITFDFKSEISGALTVLDKMQILRVFKILIFHSIVWSLPGTIQILIQKKAKQLCISIQFNSPGLSKKELPLAFDKFVRFQCEAGDKNKPTGLGLYLAKKIIGMHKGRLSVQSRPNKDTKFLVFLPVTRPKAL